jgi:hypothetical protein
MAKSFGGRSHGPTVQRQRSTESSSARSGTSGSATISTRLRHNALQASSFRSFGGSPAAMRWKPSAVKVHSGDVRCNRSLKCRDRRPVRVIWTITCLGWTLKRSAVGSRGGAQRLKRCLADHRLIGGGDPAQLHQSPLIGDGGHASAGTCCRQIRARAASYRMSATMRIRRSNS